MNSLIAAIGVLASLFLADTGMRPIGDDPVDRVERGLLLIKTEPAGCDIKIDGVSVGVTPRLITDLPVTAVYSVKLSKQGYLDRTIQVKFDGRTPIVREEKMVSDSGTLRVVSSPEGAEVTVNGISRGRTPVVVDGVARGSAEVRISLDGFVSEVRKPVMRSGEEQTLEVALKPKEGTMFLMSVPDGGTFYINGEVRGKSPLVVADLKPGAYDVKCELDGYATVTRTVTLANGASAREDFRLSNVMGRLEVRTEPVGATVVLDGKVKGVTKSASGDVVRSDVFSVEDVKEGEHTLIIRKDGYAESVKHPNVENSKTASVNVRLKRIFSPDVEVVTDRGTYRGVLVSSTSTELVIEVSLGINRSFKRADIRRMTPLK